MLGAGLTFTVTVVVRLHPALLVPVTVYVVVVVGFTDTKEPLPPELHAYVLAPEAERMTLLPAHTVAGVAEAFTVGREFTVTVADAVAVQPKGLVPVTV